MLINFTFIHLILITYVSCSHLSNIDDDASTAHRQKLVRKHLKLLKKEEGAIKLVGGRESYEGNVEIFHNGKWGAICDDEWDKHEADVICRQLNYQLGGRATHSGTFGRARRRYWMDNLYCEGRESEITQCRFDGWGQSDCDDGEAAGVVCNIPVEERDDETKSKAPVKPHKHLYKSSDEMTFRLVGGRVPSEGRVEVKLGAGPYGEICGDGWSLREANIVCKQLNLGYANEAYQTDFFSANSSGHNELMLSGTECVGNETRLADCKFESFGSGAKCRGKRHLVAGVSCVRDMADLVLDIDELEVTAHLEDRPLYFLTCAMEENCVASQAYEIQKSNTNWHLETRRLLKFTAKVLNNGTADFRPLIPKSAWEFHLCHM